MDERVRRFLQRQRVAHLATADASGAPHVVPICYVLSGETVYIAIDEKPKTSNVHRLRRLRNIAENAHVAIVAVPRAVVGEELDRQALAGLQRTEQEIGPMPCRREVHVDLGKDALALFDHRLGPP